MSRRDPWGRQLRSRSGREPDYEQDLLEYDDVYTGWTHKPLDYSSRRAEIAHAWHAKLTHHKRPRRRRREVVVRVSHWVFKDFQVIDDLKKLAA